MFATTLLVLSGLYLFNTMYDIVNRCKGLINEITSYMNPITILPYISLNPIAYMTKHSAGIDLSSCELINEENGVLLYNTRVKVAIPPGHFGMVVPRSSLHRHGYELANTIGIIDSDYRGDIKLSLKKTKEDAKLLDPIDRVAQLIIIEYKRCQLYRVTTLDTTARGEGGFGSTG